jgi:DNA-directed RNA polymerase subunit RPC12/RpoP
MYKISEIICPYCGFNDVRRTNGEYHCINCKTLFILIWFDGGMHYVRKTRPDK